MGNSSASNLAIKSFVIAANEYCRLFEIKTRLSKRGFTVRVLKSTVALYSAGLDLPNVKPDPGYNPGREWFEKNKGLPIEEQLRLDPRIREHHRRWKAIGVKITCGLGGEVPYQTVFDPLHDKEAIYSTLTDDLADIGLETHWGRHAVDAIKVLYCLLFDESE